MLSLIMMKRRISFSCIQLFKKLLNIKRTFMYMFFAFECNTKIFFGILLKIQLNFPKKIKKK